MAIRQEPVLPSLASRYMGLLWADALSSVLEPLNGTSYP